MSAATLGIEAVARQPIDVQNEANETLSAVATAAMLNKAASGEVVIMCIEQAEFGWALEADLFLRIYEFGVP